MSKLRTNAVSHRSRNAKLNIRKEDEREEIFPTKKLDKTSRKISENTENFFLKSEMVGIEYLQMAIMIISSMDQATHDCCRGNKSRSSLQRARCKRKAAKRAAGKQNLKPFSSVNAMSKSEYPIHTKCEKHLNPTRRRMLKS